MMNVVVQHLHLVGQLDPGVLVVPHLAVLDDPAGGASSLAAAGHDRPMLVGRGVILDDQALDADVIGVGLAAAVERIGGAVLAVEDRAGLSDEAVAGLGNDALVGV